jgi:hypothetical protein
MSELDTALAFVNDRLLTQLVFELPKPMFALTGPIKLDWPD